MKNLRLIIPSFVALMLTTAACNKQAADYSPSGVRQLAQQENVYDYIGEQHNKGLDYFLEHADFKDGQKQAEPLTLDFVQTQGYDRDEVAHTLADPEVAAIIHSDVPDVALRTYFKAHGMDRELKYFGQMESVLSKAATAEEAVKRLSEIESAITADQALETKSQTALLQGLAVGKHSAQYWYQQTLLGKESPWIIKTSTGGTDTSSKLVWWHVGLIDLAGAIGGGLGGGVVASIIYAVGQLDN